MSDDLGDEKLMEREIPYWLAFHQLSGAGIGTAKVKLLYEYFGSLEKAWEATSDDLRSLKWLTLDLISNFISRRAQIDPVALMNSVNRASAKVYPLFHPEYPQALREISDPPLVLFVKGSFSAADWQPAVGVVGTRKPSSYGRGLAKDIARGLAQSGATIISGMALGVDSLAHWGAIECGGRTLAVLGCGVDYCYPSSNRHLHEKLCSGSHGAVISEFFPGTKPEPWKFPARNRIIAGMSQALVVVEAGLTSGSLITARIAFEQNREVFAIPGRVDSPASAGTNQLIARNQAHLITKYADVLTEMNWVAVSRDGSQERSMVELFGREKEIFTLIEQEPIQFDVLCQKLGMGAPELSASLTMLELAGAVTRLPGDWYERQRSTYQEHSQKIL